MKKHIWFIIALVAVLFAAPHATVVRVMVDDVDPLWWALSRFVIGTVIMLPIALAITRRRHYQRGGMYMLIGSTALALAIILYSFAIYHSQASYVSILTMMTPIIFIFVSMHYFREAITRRKLAGVTLAMMGALIVVALPFILTQQVTTAVYPLATVLTIAQSFLFVTALICMRKANEAGVPMLSVVSFSAPIGVLVTLPLYLLFGDMSRTSTDIEFIAAAMYSAIGIAVLFRAVMIAAYERIGALPSAGLQYLETLVAIILPILLIGERLSIEMIAGGLLILFGVYMIESHKHPHAKHHIVHKHH